MAFPAHDRRSDASDRSAERAAMVERQIAAQGIRDERVLAAFRAVPRECFVDPDLAEFAYDDTPLPISAGQTISQPYVVALMAEAAEIAPGDKVLDVGTGSGYAAAICAQLADHVWSIERLAELAERAGRALEEAGIGNVTLEVGDGTLGWPSEAPFDAILVAAGAPHLPEALKSQLAPGGRLVIPLNHDGYQRLLVVRRINGNGFEESDLGPVQFVPLVGAQGWHEKTGMDGPRRGVTRPGLRSAAPSILPTKALVAALSEAAEPLASPDDAGFAAPFDRLGDATVVGLGEATHGTAEFYRARAAITRRLIEEHGFTLVALEADWPDAARLDRYVRNREEDPHVGAAFTRFPTWMWRNAEMRDFVDWLRDHNADLPPEQRVSIHGLDLYAMNASIDAVVGYLERVDPRAAATARERYACLSPWQKSPEAYGRLGSRYEMEMCEKEVLATLRDLLDSRLRYMGEDGDAYLDAEGNARLVAAAEEYYRTMYYADAMSWNLRDRHMFQTLEHVRRARRDPAKAVVWAHNSHIGDAKATEMGVARGELNVGELCRERYGAKAALVGFGTDRGEVAAASRWNGEMEVMQVRPAEADSIEALCRATGIPRFLLDLGAQAGTPLSDTLRRPRLERAIGVIYRPDTELASHYFEVSLPGQFDHYVWFEETHAVTPLVAEAPTTVPETFPFGV